MGIETDIDHEDKAMEAGRFKAHPSAGTTRIRFEGSPRGGVSAPCRGTPWTAPILAGFASQGNRPTSVALLKSHNPGEALMADGNGGHGALYFIVGALCVAVAVGAFFMFGGSTSGPSTAQTPAAPAAAPAPPTKNVTIEKKVIETPKVIERSDRR